MTVVRTAKNAAQDDTLSLARSKTAASSPTREVDANAPFAGRSFGREPTEAAV